MRVKTFNFKFSKNRDILYEFHSRASKMRTFKCSISKGSFMNSFDLNFESAVIPSLKSGLKGKIN